MFGSQIKAPKPRQIHGPRRNILPTELTEVNLSVQNDYFPNKDGSDGIPFRSCCLSSLTNIANISKLILTISGRKEQIEMVLCLFKFLLCDMLLLDSTS